MLKLDLHDYTLDDAYQKCQEFISEAYMNRIKKIEVITGKSGPICKEFPFWTESNHQVQYIEPSWHAVGLRQNTKKFLAEFLLMNSFRKKEIDMTYLSKKFIKILMSAN